MKNVFLIVACVLIPYGFTHSSGRIKPTFVLKKDGAKMPVVVRGNLESGILILFLHGGPGGTALKKIGTRAFNSLEENYGVVYWEQRGADGSVGGTQKARMNLRQYIDDLDEVVDQLKIAYSGFKIYLMGHCWGGGFGVAYLIDQTRQAKIAGWIDVAGAHNNPRGDSLSVEWVKAYARAMVGKGKDASYWKRALRWYTNNPAFTSDKLPHYGFVRRSSGYQLVHGDTLGKFPGYTKTDLLFRPVTFISYYSNYYKTLSSFLISDINLTSLMHRIKIPSLIIWGEKDGLIPLPMACEAFDSLGTPLAEKQLIMLPDTGHTVYYEQPILFTHAVKTFIKSHEKEAQTYSCGI